MKNNNIELIAMLLISLPFNQGVSFNDGFAFKSKIVRGFHDVVFFTSPFYGVNSHNTPMNKLGGGAGERLNMPLKTDAVKFLNKKIIKRIMREFILKRY